MHLSIIVPVYNVEKYLARCLDTLIKQDLNVKDHEIILVNDGSTDSSPLIAGDYALNHPHIKIVNQKNKGLSEARNTGIEKALGKYIYFIDSDDYIQPHVLNSILTHIIENNLDFLGFAITRTHSSNYITSLDSNSVTTLFKEASIYDGFSFIEKYYFNNGVWWYIFKKELIDKNNLRFETGRMAEDGQFTTELLLNCNKAAYIEADVYRYFKNSNSITTKKTKDHLNKLTEDFQFAIRKFETLISLAKEKKANKNAIKRLKTRQQSYVFFLFVRLLKLNIPYKEFKSIINDFKMMNLYPIKNFIGIDYHSKKEKILTYVFNHKLLLLIIIKGNNLFKVIN